VQLRRPLPVAAWFSGILREAVVTFDVPLLDNALDQTNWVFHAHSRIFTVASAVTGDPGPCDVRCLLNVPGPPQLPGGRLYYSPPPFDLMSKRKTTADAIVAFPVNVID